MKTDCRMAPLAVLDSEPESFSDVSEQRVKRRPI